MRPKRTEFKNTVYRSKLEAKWAVFFDSLGLRYEYEPHFEEVSLGYYPINYAPDFYLEDLDIHVEVKPKELEDSEIEKVLAWARDIGPMLILNQSYPHQTDDGYPFVYWKYKRDRPGRIQRWWCECPQCGKIDLSYKNDIPRECYKTCFEHTDDWDEIGPLLEKCHKIEEAYANAYNPIFKQSNHRRMSYPKGAADLMSRQPPTQRQLSYLQHLNYRGNVYAIESKQEASELIQSLLNEDRY